jgi:5-methylcytosine-specific restriction endonuclease McrA
MPDPFYSSPEWHKLRAKTKATWKAQGKPCAYCGEPIEWAIKGEAVVDHVLNRKKHPDKALDPSNLQVLHHSCNSKKAAYFENNSKPTIGFDGFPEGWK